MKFEINYTLPDGSEDKVYIEGKTVDEVIAKAAAHLKSRGGKHPWSKEIRNDNRNNN